MEKKLKDSKKSLSFDTQINAEIKTEVNYISIKTQNGIKTQMIEIKPKKQTMQPTTEGKRQKTILYEALAWRLNSAKWHAAKAYCDSHGWEFKILTEKELFG